MEAFIAILLGLALAASCGFRVFVPMLVMSVAARADLFTLSAGFAWLESWPAIIAFSMATVIEIAAYYVPWLDNALDTISAPAAAVAGTVLMAAAVAEFDPLLQWSLAVIAGGGSAALVSAGTSAARAVATAATGGLANFVVSTLELVGSIVVSLLAIVAPIAAVALLIALVVVVFYYGRAMLLRRFRRAAAPKNASA